VSTAAEVMGSELIQLTDRRQVPPCASGGDLWMSESSDERAWAAHACTGCPLLTPCADLAAEIKPSFGVWAAVDRTKQQRGHRE
jgi:Transcription factor WhiB